MKRTLKLAFGIVFTTAVVGIALWFTGYPPPSEHLDAPVGALGALVTFPLFWAGLGAFATTLIIVAKRRRFTGHKSDTLISAGILVVPLVALFAQITLPLLAYDIIGAGTADTLFFLALAVFLLTAGNYIVTVPAGSRAGFRNQWTLSDPVVWTKAHRFLGRAIVAATLVVSPIALLLAPDNAQWALLAAILVIHAIAYFYGRKLALELTSPAAGGAA